jgi:serine protease Do
MMRMWFWLVLALALVGGQAQAQSRVSFAQAVKAAGPSVVNIYAARVEDHRDTPPARGVGWAPPVEHKVSRSLGSGVIVGASGKVVTTLHVVQGADAVKVVVADGREFSATLKAKDDKLDLAVLQLDLPAGTTLPVARFADSDSLDVGDLVLAIGNPFGFGQSISLGVVSAVARSRVALNPYAQFIQTDAPLNPGSSGGALVDSTGAVVGINTAVFSKNGEAVGLGFAIPAKVVAQVVRDLTTLGRVQRPWLGLEGQSVGDDVARELGLPDRTGLLVTAVAPGSPALQAGIQNGDVVRAFGGQPVTDAVTLNERILLTPGLLDKPVTVTLWRGGKIQEVNLVLKALPARRVAEQKVMKGYNPLNGYTLEPVGPALASEYGLPLTTVGAAVVAAPATQPLAAYTRQFALGDVIQLINGQPVHDAGQAQRALDTSRRAWEMRFWRGGIIRNVTLQ